MGLWHLTKTWLIDWRVGGRPCEPGTAGGNYFMVGDIRGTQPLDLGETGSAGSGTQSENNYGSSIASRSQYAETLGMPVSSSIVNALMDDAGDGVMDGMMASGPISMASFMGQGGMMGGGGYLAASAGTSDLAAAMTSFLNSSWNQSGLTADGMNALIQQLTSSNGQLSASVQSNGGAVGMGSGMTGVDHLFCVGPGNLLVHLPDAAACRSGHVRKIRRALM